MYKKVVHRCCLFILHFTIFAGCNGDPNAITDSGLDASDRDNNNTDAGPMEIASRTQGVAPLSVFFTVIDNADIIQPPLTNNRREYADYNYHWNFGDISSGVWAIDGLSKNDAYGFVAAHVFETPGIYTVTLEVTTSERETRTYLQEIEVFDPDVVYQNADTICVSTGNDFSGCPEGALEITTSNIGDVNTHIGSGKRILLRRGDTWSTGETFQLEEISGPMTIGAFGTCHEPDARGICQNAPTINWTDNREDSYVFSILNSRDIRIMGLNLEGNLEGGQAFGGNTGVDLLLLHSLRIRDFRIPILISHANTPGHDQFTIVDCDISDVRVNVIYTGSERLALLGNRVANARESHVVRIWQSYMGVISHNDLSGSSTHTSSGSHSLKFHGPGEDGLIENGRADGLEHRSAYTVVSHNIFGGSGPMTVAITPTSIALDERISDVVVEANRFFPGHGTQSIASLPVNYALYLRASNITVRNNVFSGQDSGPNYYAVLIERNTPQILSTNIRIFNNTVYKELPGACGNCYGFSFVEAENVIIRNNLVHFSSSFTNVGVVSGTDVDFVEDHNLLTNDSRLIDPNNVDYLEKDFSLAEDSPAIDIGTETPAFIDFNRAARPRGTAFDVGAFER